MLDWFSVGSYRMRHLVLLLLALALVFPGCYRVRSSSRAVSSEYGEQDVLEPTDGFKEAEITGGWCYDISIIHKEGMDVEPENVKVAWSTGGTMVISHDFDCTNCGFLLGLVEYKVEGGIIRILERSRDPAPALCECYNSASYTLTEISPGDYHLKISKKMSGKPYLTFEASVSLPASEDAQIVEHATDVEMCGFELAGDGEGLADDDTRKKKWKDERLLEFQRKHNLSYTSGENAH